MEVIDKLIAVIKELYPVIVALSVPIGSLWYYIFHGRKKYKLEEAKAADAQAAAPPVVQGTPVPASDNELGIKALELIGRITSENADLQHRLDRAEAERDAAHNVLRANGLTIP